MRKPEIKFGLCLSGGGARGAAHIGVVKVLDKYVKISQVCGVSAGSIVAVSYAAGKLDKLEDEVRCITKRNVSDFLELSKRTDGLLSSKKIEDFVESIVGPVKLQDLKIPVTIAASDIKTGKQVFFRRGKAARVVAASSAIPGIFTPVRIGNMILLDGGIYNNLPSYVISSKVDKTISVNVGLTANLIHFKNNFQLKIEALKTIKDELNVLRKEMSSNRKETSEERVEHARKVIQYIRKIRYGSWRNRFNKEETKFIINSIITFLSEFTNINPKFALGTDYLINPNVKIAHLNFSQSKKVIKSGEAAAMDFLEKHNFFK